MQETNIIHENHKNNILFNTEINNKNINNKKSTKYKRKNGKCNFCGKKGHCFYECRLKIKHINTGTKGQQIKSGKRT